MSSGAPWTRPRLIRSVPEPNIPIPSSLFDVSHVAFPSITFQRVNLWCHPIDGLVIFCYEFEFEKRGDLGSTEYRWLRNDRSAELAQTEFILYSRQTMPREIITLQVGQCGNQSEWSDVFIDTTFCLYRAASLQDWCPEKYAAAGLAWALIMWAKWSGPE